jgi:phenylpyruvate tautomerase PptA (4-oxalocrotonate tautomerase family)
VPLYTVTTQTGVLDAKGRSQLAAGLTQLHCEMSGVPRNWVHIIFHEFPRGSGFTAGDPAATGSLTLLIRTGRTAEYKRELLRRLWQLLQAATGAPDDQLVIGIQEVPPSQAMEMGQVMPEVAGQ